MMMFVWSERIFACFDCVSLWKRWFDMKMTCFDWSIYYVRTYAGLVGNVFWKRGKSMCYQNTMLFENVERMRKYIYLENIFCDWIMFCVLWQWNLKIIVRTVCSMWLKTWRWCAWNLFVGRQYILRMFCEFYFFWITGYHIMKIFMSQNNGNSNMENTW